MPEETFVPRPCPKCGAAIHPDASFCPYCAENLKPRIELHPPKRAWGRILRWALLALFLLSAGAGLYLAGLPRVYDARGEVIYSDQDGTYQLVLAEPENRYQPEYENQYNAVLGEEYRFPVQLYISHNGSGSDVGQLFLQKVAQVTAEVAPPKGGSGTIVCTEPAPHSAFPGAALVTLVDFVVKEDFSSQVLWTLTMDNGDVIRLRQDLHFRLAQTYDYYPEDYPMETIEELQALVDHIEGTVDLPTVVNLYLPPVTYEGDLLVEERSINLYGTTAGGRRTTFTGSLRLDVDSNQSIAYLQGIDFRGSGQGIAVSSAARVWAEDCTFTGWQTGLLGYGSAWVNVIDCQFGDNEVGFHFNSTGTSVSHSMYNDNLFRNNGTAVLLENVPTDIALDFRDSVFSGNGTDIDNRCGQALDISRAVFE